MIPERPVESDPLAEEVEGLVQLDVEVLVHLVLVVPRGHENVLGLPAQVHHPAAESWHA